MATSRRQFIQQLFAGTALPAFPLQVKATVPGEDLLASAYRVEGDEQFGVAVCDSTGRILSRTSLPGRAHASVFHPGNRQLVVFARRPGRFMHIFDLIGISPTIVIDSSAGRHFYGHGCFNASGSLLYATENDYDAARGLIGIYDTKNNYKRLGEFSTYGVGPHDVVFDTDRQTLIVANGGIETHPATGAEKLNLLEMQSSLVLIDVRTGALIRRFRLPDEFRKLSLRHLGISTRGDCCFGGQYEGDPADLPPLAGCLSREGELSLWPVSPTVVASLKNYISSVCAIPDSYFFAASSSRGGVTLVWDNKNALVRQVIQSGDGSGIAASPGSLYLTGGDGTLQRFANQEYSRFLWIKKYSDIQWDNHLAVSP